MPPQSSSNQTPYDFFLTPPPKNKPKLVPTLGNSFTTRLLLFSGGIIVLILLIVIFSSLVLGHKNTNTTGLVSIAQQQNEIIRIATSSLATHQETQNLAIDVELSITSAQQQLLSYMAKYGNKVSTKTLALNKNVATDQQLQNAQSISNYDAVFINIIQQQLKTYEQSMTQYYAITKSSTTKQLLHTDYLNAKTLLTEATQAAQSLGNS